MSHRYNEQVNFKMELCEFRMFRKRVAGDFRAHSENFIRRKSDSFSAYGEEEVGWIRRRNSLFLNDLYF